MIAYAFLIFVVDSIAHDFDIVHSLGFGLSLQGGITSSYGRIGR